LLWGRRVFLGPDLLCWLCSGLWLLGAINGWFVGQSLNFFLHLVYWQLLFWLEAVRVTQVWLQLLREVRLLFMYPCRHLGSSPALSSWWPHYPDSGFWDWCRWCSH
jgi:hypothetical protein